VSAEITQLLKELSAGEHDETPVRLLPLVYDELRRLAAQYLSRERSDHTLQPTALVHEAFLRLVDQTQATWQDRAHFFRTAARAMRRILVDHARAHSADKRGGLARRLSLEEAAIEPAERATDLLALDEALQSLAKMDERKARVVELRFFGGLSVDETAEVLDVHRATVLRDWEVAKLWLYREISQKEANEG
jgi:RNA polymerase sigma factor (TIGR02999 family)